MNLKQFKNLIKEAPKGAIFGRGISYPMSSCTGKTVSYDIVYKQMSRGEILERIRMAKGHALHGESNGNKTTVTFEYAGYDDTEGMYAALLIKAEYPTAMNPKQILDVLGDEVQKTVVQACILKNIVIN